MSSPRRPAALLVCVALLGALIAFRSCGGMPTDAPVLPPTAAPPSVGTTGLIPGQQPRPRRERAAARELQPTVETPDAEPPPAEATTGVSLEVVDESGAPALGAAVRLWFADGSQYSAPGAAEVAELTVREYHPSADRPVVLDSLPREADGIRLRAYGTAEAVPPLAPVEFAIHAGRLETVRLVAAKARTVDAIVVDAATDRPIAAASVVSATEKDRRHAVGLGDPTPATTDAEGRCRVEGLGLGEHEFEIDARGYHRAQARWAHGELRVRLEPQSGACKVIVRVLGPDGVPVPDVRVSIVRTNRELKTDAAGTAVFDDVAAGVVMVSLDETDWGAAVAAGQWKVEGHRRMTFLEDAEAGESYELLLGIAPAGLGSIEGRLVGEDGAPIANAKVEVFDVGNTELSADTDADGNARFAPLPKGDYQASVSLAGGASWYFDGTTLGDGEHARVTWTLGAMTIRGRVVSRADRRGVAGVSVWLRGAVTGVATSGADGRFELPRARAGTYRIDAGSATAGALDRTVTIPVEGDLVVELVEYGRLAVRFAAADREVLRSAEARLYAAGADRDGSKLEPGTGANDRLDDQVLPGRYEVEVTLGDRKRRFPVEVRSGETSTVEVGAP